MIQAGKNWKCLPFWLQRVGVNLKLPAVCLLPYLFILGGSRITEDGDCSHEIKTLAPWKKSCDQPRQNIKKQTLLTKVRLIKAMVFPVVMSGCESWTIKEAECQRIDVFELWCWRRLLRVPSIARRSNQSILKGISPEYPLEGLMLTEAEAPIVWPPNVKN